MVRTLWFIIVAVLGTAWGASMAVLFGLFKRYSQTYFNMVLKPWGKLLVWGSGAKVEVSGMENIRPGQSYIIVANHQSHMDIPIVLGYLPLRMTILAKKELFKIPLFGQGMRGFGILEIDRSDRTKAFETLKQAGEILLKEKLSLLMFPEGTRSEDGEIHDFKKGAFLLAGNTRILVLPVTIKGSFDLLPKGRLQVKPGVVKVTIHPSMDGSGYKGKERNEFILGVRQKVLEGFEAE